MHSEAEETPQPAKALAEAEPEDCGGRPSETWQAQKLPPQAPHRWDGAAKL